MSALYEALVRLDGRPYPAYRDLEGRWWDLGGFTIRLDRVQGDPFAAPTRVSLRIHTQIPPDWCRTRAMRTAVEDWLLRRFGEGLQGHRRGSGRSGQLGIYRPGPEICERSALRIDPEGEATIRFTVGLPARGRRILGRQAALLLTEDVPAAARRSVVGEDPALWRHLQSVLRQRALREALRERGLVAFIEDGSILPRASGVSQAPLDGAVPFRSPPSLRVTLSTPHGDATGMGIPAGVTVLTGGGFHGKSTVLHALQRGHLDHIPGDGREGVVTVARNVKVRAEDGRAVRNVDIGDFLRELPGGRSTRPFSTDDASGSTSQAASIAEALEVGAELLLLDEDTSATNLLVRDRRMEALIPDDREPIVPFVRRVRQLAERGVSTVLVVGGVATYLGAADRVIAMVDWQPHDITDRARALIEPPPPAPGPLHRPGGRRLLPRNVEKVRARDTRAVSLDREEIALTAVEQVLDSAHAATLGHAVRFLLGLADGERSLSTLLDALDAILDDEGVEALSPWTLPPGDLVRPRRFEVAAALNRYRAASFRWEPSG